MSDLHIDLNHFGPFELETLLFVLKREAIDHLHIAGDLANHFDQDAVPFIEELRRQLTVTYNLGNHDMLDLTEETIQAQDFQIHDIGQRKLLAFQGWYDYSFNPEKSADKHQRFKQTFWFDRRLKRPLSDPDITRHSLERLEKILTNLDQVPLVAMHFVPHQNFTMTHPKFTPFNAFLGSQKYHQIFVDHQVTDVVFGHAHRSYGDQTIDGVTYHSRPLGYLREWDLTIDFVNDHPEYNPTGSWNLSKRYNAVKKLPEFQAYKRQHLAQEFRNSMTIFEC
ncbi:hypothetical protein STRDD12_00904 [Streptococcus sp. DD12]|nr:hypothetical protein STRDD12_00904 [Streptococcus sp. DD12]